MGFDALMLAEGGLIESIVTMDEDTLIPMTAIVMGCSVGIIAIVFGTMTKIVTVRAREATVRELSSYVAAGDMRADDAVSMLKAGRSDKVDDDDLGDLA